MKSDFKKIKVISREIINKLVAREKIPHDFGTGDIIHRFELHIIELVGKNTNINIVGLATKLNVTKGAVSQVVSKLVKKGYLEKQRNPENPKEIQLFLTSKGKIVYDKHEKFHLKIEEKMNDYVSGFSSREQQFIMEILTTINKHLSEI